MNPEIYKTIKQMQKEENWFFRARNELIIDIIKELKHKSVLDVGCSEGSFLSYLSINNFDFTGIDNNISAIGICKDRGYSNNIHYMSADKIEFKDDNFDCVTCLDVLEHIEDDKAALSEIYRVCKYNAILILPAHKYLYSHNDKLFSHFRRYDTSDVYELTEKVGFKIKKMFYFNKSLYFAFFIAAKISDIFKRDKPNTLMPMMPFLNDMLYKIIKKDYGTIGSSLVAVLEK